MSTLASRRPRLLRPLATSAFVLILLFLTSSDASAQSGGAIHRYFANFYGRDYYDGQRTGLRAHRGTDTQYHGGFYGPAMMYGRQYGDEAGYRTDPPFAPISNGRGKGFGGNYFPE